jgi:ATP-dependent RNA helicase RhlE
MLRDRPSPFYIHWKDSKLTTFEQLNLSAPILKALLAEGYTTPTPIQAQAIPSLLEGKDLLGIAQTGTGKTAAFALPILERLAKDTKRTERGTCRVLILSPTRELASQIHESFKTYGKNLRVSSTVVFGGVGIGKQIETAKAGVDIIVATPGRLVDLIERRALSLSKVEVFVLDEVDQMLDLGFIHAIRKITGLLPKQRQNLFFSATMPKEIAGLAAALLRDPVRVEITPVATTAERVTQSVIHVDPAKKAAVLVDILKNPQITRALIFTRTKHGADKVVKVLEKDGLRASAIHGNKSQANREKALGGFKAGKILALVATDIAARGIDVDGVSHVFNYDLPFVPESYVHRIGRTARAGATGEAIAFCTPEDRGLLRDIEKTIRQRVPVKEHEMGLKVDELAPNFGWDPDKKRSSGGGRHMPKKPHRGQGGQRPAVQANDGRKVEGDRAAPGAFVQRADGPPKHQKKRRFGGPGRGPDAGPNRGEQSRGGPSRNGPARSPSANRPQGGTPNASGGNGGGGGNWMRQISVKD